MKSLLTIMLTAWCLIPSKLLALPGGTGRETGKATSPVSGASQASRSSAWQPTGAGLPPGGPVTTLGVDRSGVYAGVAATGAGASDGALFRSTDRGATWVRSVSILAPIPNGLVFDPRTPGALHLAEQLTGTYSIVRSRDGGMIWTDENPPPPAVPLTPGPILATALAVDPSLPDVLYAGLTSCYFSGCSGQIDRTGDGGSTWVALPLHFFAAAALAVDPVSSTVYADTRFPYGTGLERSTDAGNSWTRIAALAQANVDFIAVAAGSPSRIFVGTGRLYRSVDGGVSWADLQDPAVASDVRTLVVDSHLPSLLLAGTARGVYRSDDGGDTWSPAGTDLPDPRVTVLALDPDTSRLYAGTEGGDVFVLTVDEGPGLCTSTSTSLCLNGDRFRAEISWSASAGSGEGAAFRLTPDAGAFWFFSPNNLELTDVACTLTITDTATGSTWTHSNRQGTLASFVDTAVF